MRAEITLEAIAHMAESTGIILRETRKGCGHEAGRSDALYHQGRHVLVPEDSFAKAAAFEKVL